MALTTPIRVNFGETEDKCLDSWVEHNLKALIESYSVLHEQKIPEWRRLTKGVPKEKIRNFPWPGASNVIIQLIGENVSTLKAIQLGTIYEIAPLWVEGIVGEWPATPEEDIEEMRVALEEFMTLMGLTKTELDLYRVESRAAHDLASLGSVLIKLPWLTTVEQLVTGIESDSKPISEDLITYDGPRPEKLPMEDWAATPTAQSWEDAGFKYHRYTLTKQQVEDKVFKGFFDKTAWEELEKSPDILGLTPQEEQKLRDSNIDAPAIDKDTARWVFFECWFKYRHNDKCWNIIYTAHYNTEGNGSFKKMNAIFNFYPRNEEPFEYCRLGYDEDGIIGYGFAEMGEMYQEDVATKHNQRNDNHTVVNTSVLFAGNNPRVDAGISLFPMAVLPFDKNEVDIKQLGVPDNSSVQEEELTIALAKARFGTDMMSAEGQGTGNVDKKGNYNTMGTFSVMQQGARRINVNIADFRYMHLNMGNKFQRQYAYFGVGNDRLKRFGKQALPLRKALEAVKNGLMEFPVKAATASINREVEKQVGMLFTQQMERHYATISQIMQGIINPVIPPEQKEILIGSIKGLAYVMSKMARAFGFDDIERLFPEMKVIRMIEAQQQKGANNGQSNVSKVAGPSQTTTGGQGLPEVTGAQDNNPNALALLSTGNGG